MFAEDYEESTRVVKDQLEVTRVEGNKVYYLVNGRERLFVWHPRRGKIPDVGDYIRFKYAGFFRLCIKDVDVIRQ